MVGGGSVFTYQGVINIFRNKGTSTVMGIWWELNTHSMIIAYWIIQDALMRDVPWFIVVPLVFLEVLAAGIFVIIYLMVLLGLHMKRRLNTVNFTDNHTSESF
eukprot:TRINITY_DN11395_c0_g1_i1.p1 TRINITY_DN11395_c0_g1~~TRINITY_DN11395_c0_g1_i1.p1  ORF type:complete len:103 (-),score=12.08 TRINITY_DN11395_c0_g1_i1:55-363(-)